MTGEPDPLEALAAWSLEPRDQPDVPIYKGMAQCPYCMVEVTDEVVERAASELYAAGPWGEFFAFADEGARAITDSHAMDVYRSMAREILRVALDERHR